MQLDPEDQTIVDLAHAGARPAALERFVTRHGARLRASCRRLAGSPAEADDVFQELLVQVDRSLPAFRGESGLSTWAFRIAAHVALNRRRTLAARAPHVDLATVEPSLPAGAEAGGDPDFSCVSSFRAWVVERALLALPEAQRVALTLHDLEEMTASETAALLGIETNAVKQRVHRARRNLRQRIAREFAARGVEIEAIDSIGCVSGLFDDVRPAAATPLN